MEAVKPTEFRIGNMVTATVLDKSFGGGKISGILESSVFVNTIKFDLSHISGIPITEEWLLRFGFKFDGHIYEASKEIREKSNKDIGVKYQAYFFNKRLNRWMDCQTRVCVDYIHQLQNLYFALTGEELTLNGLPNG